jgi:signal transduction histidine kinase
VAHELNEPLGNILGFAQLLQKDPMLLPETRSDVEKITVASLRAREIIRKLLVFARQSTPKMSRVNLNQLVDDTLQLFGDRCATQGVELEVLCSANIPQIVADPSQLTQVLVNLLVNAIQAMPDGGRLTVRTDSDDGNVRLVVEDTGIGMSQQAMDQVFVPFFTTKDVGQGTGLGLSTADGIVAAHHGSILVESTLGHGSRFEVRLPVDSPTSVPPGADPSCTANAPEPQVR